MKITVQTEAGEGEKSFKKVKRCRLTKKKKKKEKRKVLHSVMARVSKFLFRGEKKKGFYHTPSLAPSRRFARKFFML